MCVKMEFGGMLINVISAYAPQTGYRPEVKEAFWTDLDEVLVSLPRQERVFIGSRSEWACLRRKHR